MLTVCDRHATGEMNGFHNFLIILTKTLKNTWDMEDFMQPMVYHPHIASQLDQENLTDNNYFPCIIT